MRPTFLPPSSPTPHNIQTQQTVKPLIPDTTSQPRRKLARAGSSDIDGTQHPTYGSTGYVTATGLINWKRKKRSTGVGSVTSDEGGKLGLGMGMQGTPAKGKRRKMTVKKSIGLQSTPKEAHPIAQQSHSSSSLSCSSLSDPNRSVGPGGHTDYSPFVVPQLVSLDISPITNTQATDASADVFGIMTYIAPNPPNLFGEPTYSINISQHSSTMETLFGQVEDLTIPVAFPSSERSSPKMQDEHTDDSQTQAARKIMRESGGRFQVEYMVPLKFSSLTEMGSESDGGSVESDETVRPAKDRLDDMTRMIDTSGTISHADVTVPLTGEDDTSRSGRLTASILRSSLLGTTKFSSGRIGSRVKDRVSTPYRGKGAPSTSDSTDDTTSATTESRDLPEPAAGDSSSLPTDNVEDDKSSAGQSLVPLVSPARLTIDEVEDAGPMHDVFAQEDQCEAELPLASDFESRRSTRSPRSGWAAESVLADQTIQDESFEDPEPFHDVYTGEERETPTRKTDISSSSSFESIWIPPLVKGALSPVPFIPSSQLGTPPSISNPSVPSFTTTLPSSQRNTVSAASSSLTDLSAVMSAVLQRPARSTRQSQRERAAVSPRAVSPAGKWLGAEMMARMDGREE